MTNYKYILEFYKCIFVYKRNTWHNISKTKYKLNYKSFFSLQQGYKTIWNNKGLNDGYMISYL